MTRLYDALMRASKERGKMLESPVGEEIPSRKDRFDLEEEMLSLVQSIESQLLQKSHKVIQFIGSKEGRGASTVVREFADFSASRIGLSVLHMGSDRVSPSRSPSFDHQAHGGWAEIIRDPRGMDRVLQRLGDAALYVCPAIDFGERCSEILDDQSIRSFFETLRERFDLIVIESAPNLECSLERAILQSADGVVLVFESEEPDWTVSENPHESGLAFVLDSVGQGVLFPQQVVRCLGLPLLLLLPSDSLERG